MPSSEATTNPPTPTTQRSPTHKCRHIETLFAKDLLMPESPHGDNFFLPAHIIYESSRDGCGAVWDKRSG